MNDFQETQKRVFDAAENLYKETGRMPTVHQVRRLAGVDMNTTCELMREWKARQNEKTSNMLIITNDQIERLFHGAADLTKQMGEDTEASLSSNLKYWQGEQLEKRQKIIAKVMAEYYEVMSDQLAIFRDNKATVDAALEQHADYIALQVKSYKLLLKKHMAAISRLKK